MFSTLNLIVLLPVFVAILIVLFIIWYFTHSEIHSLQKAVIADQKLAAWMVQANDEITQLRHTAIQPKRVQNVSLLTIVDHESKINRWNTYLFAMKQDDNNQIELSFNRISFDDLISGVETLWATDNIQIDKMSVQRIETTNFVKAALVLKSA